MKQFIFIVGLFICFVKPTQAQVGVGNDTPEAMLDITNANQGLLIPRISLNSITDIASVLNPTGGALPVSTIIYNDGTGGVSLAGYYSWNGSSWVQVANSFVSGMQFYSWDTDVLTQPNIDNPRNILDGNIPQLTPSLSGIYTGDLDGNVAFDLTDPSTDRDGFTIRFVGTYEVQNTGDFTISLTSNDGSRLYIDGVLIIDSWFDQTPTTRSNTINLTAGKHQFEFWYYEQQNTSVFSFNWGANPDGNTGVISASQFRIE